jgi:sugar (pentulose or hexulose) kinase
MYWDILRLFFEVKIGIRKALQKVGKIDAIGIDTWGVDFALIDKKGEMIGNPVHYRDERTVGMPEEVFETVSKHELYQRTGIQCMRINTIYQLYYLCKYRPELVSAAESLLFIPDLFAYLLTGEKRAEWTIATTSNMVDPAKGEWAYDILEKLGIESRLLPPMINPGEAYGNLLPELCEEFGCDPIPVIAVCTHDTASAVLSAPAEGDFAYISCGTWSLFGTELSGPVITDASERVEYTNEGGYNGSITFLRNIMGLWLIQESRRQWRREGQEYSFAQMETWAKECKPLVSLIDPDDASFATPGNMPERVRAFCRRTGQPVPETVGEVVRCIYESLALKYRKTAESIEQLMGRNAKVIHVVGGGTKDKFLSQMTADACGIPVAAGPEEATAIGNLMMQAIAAGEVADLKQAREIVAASFELKHYQPSPERDMWDEAYARFCALN